MEMPFRNPAVLPHFSRGPLVREVASADFTFCRCGTSETDQYLWTYSLFRSELNPNKTPEQIRHQRSRALQVEQGMFSFPYASFRSLFPGGSPALVLGRGGDNVRAVPPAAA
jgi:hypothetical protein